MALAVVLIAVAALTGVEALLVFVMPQGSYTVPLAVVIGVIDALLIGVARTLSDGRGD